MATHYKRILNVADIFSAAWAKDYEQTPFIT